MSAPEIDQYDQDTLGYLTAVGMSPQLVERVNRMAKDAAHWKQQALAAQKAIAEEIAKAIEADASHASYSEPEQVTEHLLAAATLARKIGGAR